MSLRIKCFAIISFIIAVIVYLVISNVIVKKTYYNIKLRENSKNSIKVLQVSDFHNSNFGKQVIKIAESVKPDYIFLTGDMIDAYKTNIEKTLALIKELSKITTCYYISGNHEYAIPTELYNYFISEIESYNVINLDNKSIALNQDINLIGFKDPRFQRYPDNLVNKDKLNILLSHRPENFWYYKSIGVDLVFTGHTHGGQFRLPFYGGLFAPDQGILPKYDAGWFIEDNCNMIINTGFWHGWISFRLNNPPEVVIADINY